MNTSALIAAAGSPDVLDAGHPLEQSGSITAIERIVATLRKSGIHRIVVVTGYRGGDLERLLVSSHVLFIHNKNYKNTDMLDSVKIGLEFLKDKTDRILFTPADVPLFTCGTVKELMASGGSVVVPVCNEKQGHPILFSHDLIDPILSFKGHGGLQAFFRQNKETITCVSVEDQGIFLKNTSETASEYSEQLKLHNMDIVRTRLNIGLAREKVFFDEQVFNLLMLIDETGNVREACKHMHISYTTSWNLIQRLENELQCQLVSRAQGGSRGSHSELTPYAREFLALYAAFTDDLRRESERLYEEYFYNFFQKGTPV